MDIAYSKNRCQMFVLKLSGIKKYLKGWLMFWQCIKLQWERWYGISIDYIWDQYFPYVEHWYVISISICRYISKCTKGFKFNVWKFSSGWEGRGDVSVQKKRVQIDLKKVEGFIYQQLLNPLKKLKFIIWMLLSPNFWLNRGSKYNFYVVKFQLKVWIDQLYYSNLYRYIKYSSEILFIHQKSSKSMILIDYWYTNVYFE